jgi:cytidyltransferase-like protein
LRLLVKKDWGAKIISLEEFEKIRPKLGRVVATSGGFDPIHPGHISCIIESKKLGDTLVVIVNGDQFLTTKKGKPFQNLETRSLIVSGITDVDFVIPFEIENDQTVVKALDRVKPNIFTKGGDRNQRTLPPAETQVCKRNNIKVVFGVGESKRWSSSWFLDDWEKNRRKAKRTLAAKKFKEKLDKYLTS